MNIYEKQDQIISIGGSNDGVTNAGNITGDVYTQNALLELEQPKQQLQQSYRTLDLLEGIINSK